MARQRLFQLHDRSKQLPGYFIVVDRPDLCCAERMPVADLLPLVVPQVAPVRMAAANVDLLQAGPARAAVNIAGGDAGVIDRAAVAMHVTFSSVDFAQEHQATSLTLRPADVERAHDDQAHALAISGNDVEQTADDQAASLVMAGADVDQAQDDQTASPSLTGDDAPEYITDVSTPDGLPQILYMVCSHPCLIGTETCLAWSSAAGAWQGIGTCTGNALTFSLAPGFDATHNINALLLTVTCVATTLAVTMVPASVGVSGHLILANYANVFALLSCGLLGSVRFTVKNNRGFFIN